ncbi:uncharacterized protein [Henckelia pumila]|uniref:uncharacterized protein n=1 Tax=Henckelia pumila TaxID=405737 RepID=UPI003C6DED50
MALPFLPPFPLDPTQSPINTPSSTAFPSQLRRLLPLPLRRNKSFMGACFSSQSSDQNPSANVVSVDGQLRQYSLPVTSSQVIGFESSSPESFFLCDSDSLCFDDFIPPLSGDLLLQSDQIYFVLSTKKLQYRLAASDMAALAVKASIALDKINSRRRGSKARISPVLVAEEHPHPQSNYQIQNKVSFDSPVRVVSRSGPTAKLQRFSSRRAKLAVRSFKIRLSTIYEGSVHDAV